MKITERKSVKRVRVIQDTDPMSPRDWDNVGRMVCWHSRYNLGDTQPSESPQEWLRSLAANHVNAYDAELIPEEHIARILAKHFVILPLYLYDHSGITMSCAPFACPWDSGQVGWIYCTRERAIAECGSVEAAERNLRIEVETYDQYITGDVYGYIVEEREVHHAGNGDEDSEEWADDDWETVDSRSGFYGSDPRTNGMADNLGDSELVALACAAEIEYPR